MSPSVKCVPNESQLIGMPRLAVLEWKYYENNLKSSSSIHLFIGTAPI